MARRGGALDLAVLGVLQQTPMHGYELRKRVNALLGWGRVLSYGTLYPALKALLRAGLIESDEGAPAVNPRTGAPRTGKRARIVYHLTDAGRDHLATLLDSAGPAAWDDENFAIHFAFFARTDHRTRLRILEGRRARLEERLAEARAPLADPRDDDPYARELRRYAIESVERELQWLVRLIAAERTATDPSDPTADVAVADAPDVTT